MHGIETMKIINCPIAGLKVIQLDVHGDARGFFVERFHVKRFSEAGLPHIFLQDNHSRSAPRTLRGLHYQYAPPQGKLVGVARGRVWDIAVDIRPKSPTFGRHHAVELTAENGMLLWIPAGFAHGFCVLGEEPADLLYKVTAVYNPASEGGIRFNDPELGIDWPIKEPLISERDKNLPSFSDYKNAPPEWST